MAFHRKVTTFVVVFLFAGCDSAYRYAFFPPERIEYTLVPDAELMAQASDTSYSISRDSLSVVFDRKTFKVEVQYLSDYHLNNIEFPDDSKDGEFSANPFTYANWVDPQLGYTPNRFSVFKVSIFNYTMSKINFDPEKSFLVTDRGDIFPGYGREERTSKNESLEAYFRKRKGSSGVDDEIFERRMGIVRQTVLSMGRPIYQGDSREGIVVYDPLHESVEKIKLVLNDFIIGYDENNEPSEFLSLQFFFRRIPLRKETIGPVIATAGGVDATDKRAETKRVEFHQLRYNVEGRGEGGAGEEDWNSKPNALRALAKFIQDSLNVHVAVKETPADSPNLDGNSVAFLLAGPTKPLLTDIEVSALANLIRRGGFLVIDNAVFPSTYQYYSAMQQVLESIGAKLEGNARVATVPPDHELYRSWRRLTGLPQGMDDIENMPDRRSYLEGLFWRNRLVAVMSSKGYSMVWDRGDPNHLAQFVLGANIVSYAARLALAQ
jgi:hypothetical protein